MPAAFVHLRVHTSYSLAEGAIRPKTLAEMAARHAMPAVAVTDSNNMFGALDLSQTLAGAGIQPIIGCQFSIAVTEEGDGLRGPAGRLRNPDHLVLLAKDETGYLNLMALSSAAYLQTPAGTAARLTPDQLEGRSDGLICLTGGPSGALARLVGEGKAAEARAELARLQTLFGDRLYVELQRHGQSFERKVEPALIELAYESGVPLVATNDCYFPERAMYEAHDILLCIADGTYVNAEDRRRVTAEHYFKPPEEMAALFEDLPEAVANTLVIAQRCAVMAEKRDPILPSFGSAAESEPEQLRRMAHEGLARRIGDRPEAEQEPYRTRLDYELDVIEKMGFPGYFLIVADFIQWAKAHDIPVGPGRGSGAGSVVAWALTITDVDPLRFGLLFERFLNPERISMPDFDIDFCQERRDEVIAYVRDKYGADQVAQIITFGTLQARAALKDVGRVMQLPYTLVDKVAKTVPNAPGSAMTLAQAVEQEPQIAQFRRDEDGVDEMVTAALKLEGLYRNASTHAAGVVIGDRPLQELVPLYRDPRAEMPATQYSMKYAEQAGLVKFDFLGLKTLSVLNLAVRLVADSGIDIDLAQIPLDDRKVYEMLSRGETVGVFQFESSGMRDSLRVLRPDTIEDLVAMVALYRPGPMDNIPRFIKCKHGEEVPDYLHPKLEGILRETYGIIVYQEQVMQIAQVLAGYSLGEADVLRRAMGKKDKAQMAAQKERFIDGAKERGVDAGRAAYIFDLVDKFAGYGFNKSHAVAYGLVAYQTAWLKANHPVEFLAASMSFDRHNTDKLTVFRQELARMKVPLLPPDVNRSQVNFSVEREGEGAAVRYALAAVKNVGEGAMGSIVRAREAEGRPFRDLADFADRVDPAMVNKRMLENLARAGGFDALEPDRARAFGAGGNIIRFAAVAAEARASAQTSLFGGAEPAAAMQIAPDVDSWTPMETLAQEFDAIGFYLSAHPLDSYAKTLERLGVQAYADVMRRLSRSTSSHLIAGTVISKQVRRSAKGNRFAFIQCSDPTGMFEVTVFSEILSAHFDLLEPGRSVLFRVEGRIDDRDQPRLMVQSVDDLDIAAARAEARGMTCLRVFVGDQRAVGGLDSVLAQTAKGKGKIVLTLHLAEQGHEADIALPGGYALSPRVRGALKSVRGVLDVREMAQQL